MSEHTNPLHKQLLGAAVGTVIALTLYGVYTLAAPPLTAFVSSVLANDTASGLTFTEGDRFEKAKKRLVEVKIAKELIEKELSGIGQ